MFNNFLVTMAPLKNGMDLSENTISIKILMGAAKRLCSRKMKIYNKKL